MELTDSGNIETSAICRKRVRKRIISVHRPESFICESDLSSEHHMCHLLSSKAFQDISCDNLSNMSETYDSNLHYAHDSVVLKNSCIECNEDTSLFIPRTTCELTKRCTQIYHTKPWILLFTFICVCLLNGTSAETTDFIFPDIEQGRFARDLSQFHISRPSRVAHNGVHLSHDLHSKDSVFRRRRSEPVYTSSNVYDHLEHNDVHYRIPLDHKQNVIVKMKVNKHLVAPSAIVERKVSQFQNVSDSKFSSLDHHHGCHYTGNIPGKENSSLVALYTCNGLRGFLKIDHEEYIIEPVKGHTSSSPEGRPHLVYKRSALPDHLDFLSRSKREPACGVQEEYQKALDNRDRWEKHRKSTSGNQEEKSPHARHKRSISMERHVETLVVVDTEMVQYYENEDIETYVLTVMNMVASLFHDASIGNAINIVIVRIMLLQDPDENLKITHHADKSLKSFCKWQKRINFRDDDHPNHHDVAVLLTRRNICSRMNEPCSTLGLAQVAGLCQPHRTCSINEDTGLSLAWTVAHELGHNFAMKHDNAHKECKTMDPDIQYVMAPHLTWDNTPSKWSKCSRASITKFLDRNWGYCLDDEPGHHDFTYPTLPAGTMYDADHQCRLLYGEGAERCNGIEVLENICTTLWCRVNNKCSTKLQAAAIGTICGTNKWCFNGRCVDIGERPQAIDGQWGQWQEWTSCTRTCGAGVSLSQRTCNHPPPSNGGRYCTGERKRYRICNTEPCDENAQTFRAHQCSEFDKLPYKGSKYTWEPIGTPETPCQLHCKPKDMFFSVLLKDIVTDGTPCVLGSRHMCISGRCRHVGCDWILDSNAKEDRCGVCFGDGSTCTTIKQQFNETKKLGYVEATVIPSGARNIRVEEVAEASNFLALRNDKGEYYLNGHWFIQWSGDYEVAGTVIHYKRTGNREKFLAPGPLKEPLHIMLLMQTHNPGVEFEYTVPKENVTDTRKPEFNWDYTDWSHCTVSCGSGTQRSAVVCKEQEAGLVDERFCDAKTKKDDLLRSCNVHLCPARWWTGPWQHCSVTCGDKGLHRRTVICVRSLGSDEQIALEDTACGGLDKPVEVEPCHRKEPCPGLGVWTVDAWSNCTRPCNGGLQFRKVNCTRGTHCLGVKPDDKRPCNSHLCPSKSPTINLNIPEEGEKLSDPPLLNLQLPLVSDDVKNLDNNTALSIGHMNDDIKNNQNNDVIIGSGTIEQSPIIKNVNINFSTTKTHHKHRHHNHHQKIGHGNEKHPKDANVIDIKEGGEDEYPSENETHNPGPPVEVFGNGKDSKYIWQKSDWSQCSIPCGKGVRTRQVYCIEAQTGEKAGYCSMSMKPSTIEECFESECLEWQTGNWSECSATCGLGKQQRQVICTSPGKCAEGHKPSSIRQCPDLPHCIAWVYGDWSKCSKSCDTGVQERLVQCVNLTSQQLTQGCPVVGKPTVRQDCNKDACPENVKAALTVSCESNEMSYNVCRMLKKVGLCHKEYVQAKCCRTCTDHSRAKPKKSRMMR